jgi:acetoin utilization deacetylase AcuC-like enzyme
MASSRRPSPPAAQPGPKLAPALLVDDARFDEHAPRAYHPERPERLTAAREAVKKLPVAWTSVPAREATDDELVRVHEPRFIEQLGRLRGQSGHIDPDTYVAPRSVEAARLAAGGLISMVDAILDGPIPKGVALLRPPGHHARPWRAMGFCLINNIAIAAAHARSRGVSRVLIVDWDVHHGNGTQEMFWTDPNVLFVSTHQFPFYPGTGDADEVGERDGTGFTVNVPLHAGGGDPTYRAAFERIVLPVAEQFKPELVMVSAGFDAAARDPLAEMEVSSDGFSWMAREIAKIASTHAEGKMALVLEGGYDLIALESGLGGATSAMLGGGANDLPVLEGPDDDIDRAEVEAKRSWRLG